MLSYRHAFHAGNHADVLKHCLEMVLLDHLAQKDKPYTYLDTHAGAGAYALDSGYAVKNAEFLTGIGRLWTREDLPPALARYVACIRAFNPDGLLRFYPGSPTVAHALLRPDDRMRLFELHSTNIPLPCIPKPSIDGDCTVRATCSQLGASVFNSLGNKRDSTR